MTKFVFLVLIAIASPAITGCASSGGGGDGPSGLSVTGDESGGTIPRSVGGANTQNSAFEMVTAHCAKYDKKGFITRMDFESGTMTFECRRQRPKAGT